MNINMWQRIFGNSREYVEEIKRQNMELFTANNLKKSAMINAHLRGLPTPTLKRMTIQLQKDKKPEDGALIEYILNELELRIGHNNIKDFCNRI
jgi:hypothetical protein